MWCQYVVVVLAYAFMDAVNFGWLARELYLRQYNGFTKWWAALLVYLVYPWCVLYLTQNEPKLEKAAVLGLSVYGIYHLTNMATLHRWDVGVAVYDTLWGGLVTVAIAMLWQRLSQA